MIDPADDRELATIQGTVAGAETALEPDPGEGELAVSIRGKTTIPFLGERFRIADSIGLMPLLKFSAAAELETADPMAMAAMYALLKDTVYAGAPACGTCPDCEKGNERSCPFYDAGDWNRFERHAIETKAESEELFDFVTKVIEVVGGRPTKPRPGSSAGRGRTSRSSTARSSARRGKGSKR